MPCVKVRDGKSFAAQFVYQPWRHWTGFHANAGIIAAVPPHCPLDLFRV
jgi:hypothetical protein